MLSNHKSTPDTEVPLFKLGVAVKKRALHSYDEEQEDVNYWLERTPQERIAAVTFIISQSLKHGERMNKQVLHKRTLHSA